MADFDDSVGKSEREAQHRFPSPFGSSDSGIQGSKAPERDSTLPDRDSSSPADNGPRNTGKIKSGSHRFPSPFEAPTSSLPNMSVPEQEKNDPSIPPFVMPSPDDVTPDKTLPPIEIQNLPPAFPNFPKPGDLPTKAPDKLPPFQIPGDIPLPQVPGNAGADAGRVYELRRLNNRAADHMGPDAVVRLPAGFDPSKPINLVIYNHGWGSTVQSAYSDNKLGEQMNNAPPNTVLIVPEWQKNAGANSGDQGNFRSSGLFDNMVQEIFDKTPGLAGKRLSDVASVGIFAHSAGYGPAETEIYKNALGSKVTSITLLDSLYDNTGFDAWIQANANDLASGRKQFYNFFEGTSNYSTQLANRMRSLIPGAAILTDYNNPKAVLDAATLARYPIVFKYSTAYDGDATPHYAMPHLYVGPVEAAARMRNPGAYTYSGRPGGYTQSGRPGESLPPFRF